VEHCKQAFSPVKWFRCNTRNFLLALTANYVRYFYDRPSELLLHLITICNGDQLPVFYGFLHHSDEMDRKRNLGNHNSV